VSRAFATAITQAVLTKPQIVQIEIYCANVLFLNEACPYLYPGQEN
jgi:hypothetical protein